MRRKQSKQKAKDRLRTEKEKAAAEREAREKADLEEAQKVAIASKERDELERCCTHSSCVGLVACWCSEAAVIICTLEVFTGCLHACKVGAQHPVGENACLVSRLYLRRVLSVHLTVEQEAKGRGA